MMKVSSKRLSGKPGLRLMVEMPRVPGVRAQPSVCQPFLYVITYRKGTVWMGQVENKQQQS
jgi:hypothetical protein